MYIYMYIHADWRCDLLRSEHLGKNTCIKGVNLDNISACRSVHVPAYILILILTCTYPEPVKQAKAYTYIY